MNAQELVAELGVKLGISLELSETGTCRVHFDDDDVDFEQAGNALYIMADIASAAGREDICGRLLAANNLGAESGGACIGLDVGRNTFTMHTVFRGGANYEDFEAELTLFIKALRYWKEWIALSISSAPAASAAGTDDPSFAMGMLRI